MKKMSKVCLSMLILIIISVLFSALPGCEEEKEKVQSPANVETKVTVTTEEQKAAEANAAKLKEQEKRAAADAALKAAEQKAAEKKAADDAELKAAEQKAAEQKATATQTQITLKASSETIKQILDEIGFWETSADDFRDMAVPDCNLIDLDGKPRKLSSYRGKNVLLFEWVTYSPACKFQFQFLKDLREKVSENQLAILAVAIQTDKDDLQKVKDYLQKEKISLPVFYEPQNSLSTPLQFNMYVPCSYFIRPDGTFKVGVIEIITVRDLIRVLQAK